MIARFIFLIFLLAICFSGCKKENESIPVDLKYSYFPLISGHELTYKVVEIEIDKEIGTYDTTTYQLKERFDSMFIDNSGNAAWRLERYKRNDSTQPWVILDVWVSQIMQNQAQQVEENQRIVKIAFPPEINKNWDGNVYNTLGLKTFKISGIDVSFSINSLHFDSVLTVVQENDTSLINKYYKSEQYAKYVGLIYKKNIAISSAWVDAGVPIEQRINRGILYYQTLINEQIIE